LHIVELTVLNCPSGAVPVGIFDAVKSDTFVFVVNVALRDATRKMADKNQEVLVCRSAPNSGDKRLDVSVERDAVRK
jgi:hypothetical protein